MTVCYDIKREAFVEVRFVYSHQTLTTTKQIFNLKVDLWFHSVFILENGYFHNTL